MEAAAATTKPLAQPSLTVKRVASRTDHKSHQGTYTHTSVTKAQTTGTNSTHAALPPVSAPPTHVLLHAGMSLHAAMTIKVQPHKPHCHASQHDQKASKGWLCRRKSTCRSPGLSAVSTAGDLGCRYYTQRLGIFCCVRVRRRWSAYHS